MAGLQKCYSKFETSCVSTCCMSDEYRVNDGMSPIMYLDFVQRGILVLDFVWKSKHAAYWAYSRDATLLVVDILEMC